MCMHTCSCTKILTVCGRKSSPPNFNSLPIFAVIQYSPGSKKVIHFLHGTGTAEGIDEQTVEVEGMVGRDPQNGLQVKRVELLKQPLHRRKVDIQWNL